MTKAELIERIARSRDLPPHLTKKDIARILGVAFEEISSYFARTRVTRTQSPRFTFPRFGTFTKKKRSARRGVNPRTLEPMQIDACHVLDFKASRELRELMNPEVAGSRGRGEAKPTTKAKAKAKAKPKAKPKRSGVKRGANGMVHGRKRRLTPRDEDAEIDALIDDEALFEEPVLPAAPLARVRSRETNSRARNTG
jgi:nucleoid DNA-binding protein